jgi:hypothetical protein
MDVELGAEETAALRKALQSYLSDLRSEIHDTDNHDYKRELKDERATLESVVAKLEAGASAGERDAQGRAVVRFVAVWVE